MLAAAIAECDVSGGEILVYDDASTDKSAVIVEEIAAHAAVRLLRGERNSGVFTATNVLLAHATEPYLRIIDGDDQITLGSTLHLLDVLRRYGAVLAHGVAKPIGEGVTEPGFAAARSGPEPDAFRDILRGLHYNLSAALIRMPACRKVFPLPADLRCAQDLCVVLRLGRLGRFAVTDALVALLPDERANRLSRHLAATYRDSCIVIATELAAEAKHSEAALAVRRNAARCSKYFRREAPDCLDTEDKLFLARCRGAMPFEAIERQCGRLRRMARLYARDAERVLD